MKNDKKTSLSNQESIFDLIDFDSEVDKKIPEKVRLRGNQKWCPYCSNIVEFVRDKASGVKRCPICKISEKDFWVKKVNKKQRK